MDDNLKNFLFEDDENDKRASAEYLMNKATEEFYTENELENHLDLVFDPIDISERAIATIKRLETKPRIAVDILRAVKKKKKNRMLLYSASTVAAIFFLSLVLVNLNSNKTSDSAELSSSVKNKKHQTLSQLDKRKVIELPEGVVITLINKVSYEFVNNESNFIQLNSGKVIVDVESRKDKSPLYFSMPNCKVKVTGTSFILNCNAGVSEVTVTEGSVELITNSKTMKISAGQMGSTGKDYLRKSFVLAGQHSSYSLESLRGLDFTGSPEIVPGVIGNSLKFDGSTQIIVPRSSFVADESISFWFKQDKEAQEPQTIIGQNDKEFSMNGFNLFAKLNMLGLQLKNGLVLQTNKTPFSLKKWHHIVYKRQKSGPYSLFLDGKKVISGNFPYFYKTPNIYLGKSQGGFWKFYKGCIDELKVYNRCLSDKEIAQLYNERKMSQEINR